MIVSFGGFHLVFYHDDVAVDLVVVVFVIVL